MYIYITDIDKFFHNSLGFRKEPGHSSFYGTIKDPLLQFMFCTKGSFIITM